MEVFLGILLNNLSICCSEKNMKDLTLSDYPIIKPYLDLANYEGYNSNFVTMMMWNHEYHIQYEMHEHFMVMLHTYKGIKFWAMPFTSPEYYQEAIDYMIVYSFEHEFDFVIDCAIEEFVNTIKPIYQDQLIFERTPYNDDYIYDKNMLKTLSGKKMQKRRNHYNAFIKEYPHYVYRDLDLINDFDIILNCLNKWEHEKDDLSESMTSEVRGIMSLLSSKHLLDFEVGGIFIDGHMEAFIIASRLKQSTVQIHVEKANKEIRGLYPAILKELLEHHFIDEKYVNREEDMGLENLRKSKQSLHPLKMIHKYRITLQKIEIRQAKIDDKDRIIELWKNSFKDETVESTQFYFEHCYKEENTFVLTQDKKVVTVVQIVPMLLSVQKETKLSYFILGVCTDDNYQNQGCMRKLLDYVLTLYNRKPIYLQAYVPEIYRSFGFYASHYHQIIDVDKAFLPDVSVIPSFDYSLLQDYYEAYTKHFDCFRIRDADYWNLLLKRCKAFDEQILIFENIGYLIYHIQEDSIYISEMIYLNRNGISTMLSYFKKDNKLIKLECDLTVFIPGNSEKIITMMSNQLFDDQEIDNYYINEVY